MILQVIVARSGDDIQLLLTRQIDELHGITRYADRKVRIFFLFRMLHGVLQLLHAEDVDIQMMRALIEIAVHGADQIVDTLCLIMAQRARVDRLRVGDAIQRIFIRQLGN